MTAYPLANDVSLWETFDAKSRSGQAAASMANEGDRQLPLMARGDLAPGRCASAARQTIDPRSLTVDFRHAHNELNGFMDQAERSFEELVAKTTKAGTGDSIWCHATL